jgi:hypothetical protein
MNGRPIFEGEHDTVTEKDLEHLLQLLDNKESGDTAWQNLMERTTSNMTYKAWRREPEVCFATEIIEHTCIGWHILPPFQNTSFWLFLDTYLLS